MLNLRLFIGKPNFLWSFYSVLVLYNCSFICLFCCCNSNHSLISCWANSTFKVGFTDGNLCMSHLCMINIIITVWVIGQIFYWSSNAGWRLFSFENIMLSIFWCENRCHYCLASGSPQWDRTRNPDSGPVALVTHLRVSTTGFHRKLMLKSSL